MKKRNVRGNYYLGLDIGTNSVGWAVTDNQYNVLKANGKALWGIRLFEEGSKADERRMHRASRRRIQRKEDRIKILQELFDTEINAIDTGFFQRLKDSKYYEEDKTVTQNNTLFNDANFNDKDFHRDYPTIYHLRKALIEGGEEYDVRLVYLAIHHIIKHRGHFLFEGQEMKNVTSFDNVYFDLIQSLMDTFERDNIECLSIEDVKKVLTDKSMTRTDKEKKLKELFMVDKADKQLTSVVGLLAGTTKKLSDLYGDASLDSLEKNKICFSDAGYDETRIILEVELEDRMYILDKLKAVYDWAVLTDILKNQKYLSYAKVDIYEKHKYDLSILKKLIKELCPDSYNVILRDCDNKDNNYPAYIGMTKKNGKKMYVESKCQQQDICDYLKKIFEKIDSNLKEYQYMMGELETGTFLPKQVSKENGVIPYQVHKEELKAILANAEKYLPFLRDVDETGYSVSEKILKTFEFRIPYYVGPLNLAHRDKGANNWIVKKSNEKITPWNFEDVVDLEASAEQFIKRMTNKCTYIVGADVLPKNSLLYSEFTVLNEINNIRIDGEKISVELKQKIYNSLFKKYKKVTGKKLLQFLKTEGYEVNEDDVTGFDGDFKSSLSSYHDFKKIFGNDVEKYEFIQIAEQIILWSCLYGDDKKLLKNKIKKEYAEKLSSEQIKKLSNKKYIGCGRLSREFLCDVQGASKDTGEVRSIINSLRETNDNLMMLLSQNYTYLEEIDAVNNVGKEKIEISYDLIKDMYVSPAVKHMLWQTMKVVKEITEIMGHEPEKVFIEMARGEDKVKERKDSRKKQLLELYKKCKGNLETGVVKLSIKKKATLEAIDYFYITLRMEDVCIRVKRLI